MELKVCNRSSLVDITVFPNLTPLLVFETRVRDLWLGFGSWQPICQTTYHYDYWMKYSNLFIDNVHWKEVMYLNSLKILVMYFWKKKLVFDYSQQLTASWIVSCAKNYIPNKVNPKICRTFLINFPLKFELVDISCDCAIILHIQRTRQSFSIGVTKQVFDILIITIDNMNEREESRTVRYPGWRFYIGDSETVLF